MVHPGHLGQRMRETTPEQLHLDRVLRGTNPSYPRSQPYSLMYNVECRKLLLVSLTMLDELGFGIPPQNEMNGGDERDVGFPPLRKGDY